MVHHPAAQYVGMASKKSTNGGHTQGGHVCLAGRAEIVRRVIGGEKQRALARDLGVSRQTGGATPQDPQADQEGQGQQLQHAIK